MKKTERGYNLVELLIAIAVLGVVLLSILVGLLAAAAAAIVPLLPLLFIAGAIWLFVRLSRPAPSASGA